MIKKIPKSKPSQQKLVNLLLDLEKPSEVRAKMLMDVIITHIHDPDSAHQTMMQLLDTITEKIVNPEALKNEAKYKEMVAELEQGAVRPGTFIGKADTFMPGGSQRMHVVTHDGYDRYPVLHEEIRIEDLDRGTTVFLDDKGVMVLGRSPAIPLVGQVATLERLRPETMEIEVRFRDEQLVLYASRMIVEAALQGELPRGSRLLFCHRRQFAFEVLSTGEERKRRFLDNSMVPDVTASRDIGDPHWVLGYLIRHTRVLLFHNELIEDFNFRKRCRVMMTGRTGTGKTLTIRAFLNAFSRLLEEKTGRSNLESRIIRVQHSQLLSKWFGETDKNIDALMDDVYALASEEVETASGGRVRLPLVVLLEEVEGLARRRGEYDGAVYDRVIGTLLQRLDDPIKDLGHLPVILIATTNRPDMIDAAMWRRMAGRQAHFKRLTRGGMASVLSKKLKDHFPYASRNGEGPDKARRQLIDEVVSNLFSPNSDGQDLVETTMRDGTKAIHRRCDLLTGSVVEEAVSHAIDHAVFASMDQGAKVGLSTQSILDALYGIIDNLADNLTVHNSSDYLDLPEFPALASVRRLRSGKGHLAQVTL